MNAHRRSHSLLSCLIAAGLIAGWPAPAARAQGFSDWLKRDRDQMRQFKDGQTVAPTGAPGDTARAPAASAATHTNEWLVMVYQAGDNNLDPALMKDAAEMQKVGSTDRVKIVCLTDRLEGSDWSTARRFLVRKTSETGGKNSWDTALPTCADLGELNMGDPATLRGFIAWARATHPARRTMLVIANHGDGWRDVMQRAAARGRAPDAPALSEGQIVLSRGIASDDASGNDYLENREIRAVLEEFPPLTILGADACLMGMLEVAYEWRQVAEFFVGSQVNEPNDGWPYDTILAALTRKPDLPSRQMAAEIVRLYGASYRPNELATQSAVEQARIPALAEQVDAFADALGRHLASGGAIADPFRAYFSKQVVPGNDFLDLDGLMEVTVNTAAFPQALRDAAGAVRAAFREALVANSAPGPALRGLMLYAGYTPQFSDYRPDIIQFARDTRWDETLRALVDALRGPADAPRAPTAGLTNDWLIMVYQAADNNLDPYSMLDLKEMQQVGSSDRVRITVMTDRGAGGDWQSARRFLVRRPKDQGGKMSWDPALPTCEDLGEVNMGKPETLRDFIAWSRKQHPARHTMLVLWNHGGGWRDARAGAVNPLSRGIAWDDTNDGDFLETREVRAVLEQFPKLSILAADACLMAMLEVAYEWRDHADWFIASEDIEPGDGWPYDTALPPLVGNPGMTPEAFARHIAKAYDASYARQATTISVIRMDRVADLARAVDAWAGARLAASALGGDDFFKVPGYPQGATEFYDLGALLDRDAGDAAASVAIRQAARAARQALTAAVLANHSAPQLGGTGLSVYGGKGADDADYRPEIIRLARDTRWDDFLRARQAAARTAPAGGADASPAATVGAATPPPARAAAPKPRRWAVLIGVKDYEDPTIPDLAYTMKDLAAMRNALVNSGYATNRVLLLAGKDATTANVRSLLGNELPRLSRPEDMITIYFTGHGAAEPSARGDSADGTEKYLLFQDSRKDNLYGTALPMTEMARILGRLPATKVLVLMDTCYSGAAPYRGASVDTAALLRSLQPIQRGGVQEPRVTDEYMERLAGTEGIVVMTAARAGEVAMESPRLEHGVFTYYLIRALGGEADANQDGLTTVHEAYGFLSDNVTREAGTLGVTQRPVMKGEVSGDFPLTWR